jgi:hypothetical protein
MMADLADLARLGWLLMRIRWRRRRIRRHDRELDRIEHGGPTTEYRCSKLRHLICPGRCAGAFLWGTPGEQMRVRVLHPCCMRCG